MSRWTLANCGRHRKQYNRMVCYGRPSGWYWSVKDKFDGPVSRNDHNLRHSIRRNMRKRARREAKQFLQEMEQDA